GPLRVRCICFGEDDTFGHVNLAPLGGLRGPRIVCKLERILICFRSARWIVDAERNDNKTIYDELAALRDRRFGGRRNTQAFRDSRIRGHEAAVPFPNVRSL